MNKENKTINTNVILAFLVCILTLVTLTGGIYHFTQTVKTTNALVEANSKKVTEEEKEYYVSAIKRIQEAKKNESEELIDINEEVIDSQTVFASDANNIVE